MKFVSTERLLNFQVIELEATARLGQGELPVLFVSCRINGKA